MPEIQLQSQSPAPLEGFRLLAGDGAKGICTQIRQYGRPNILEDGLALDRPGSHQLTSLLAPLLTGQLLLDTLGRHRPRPARLPRRHPKSATEILILELRAAARKAGPRRGPGPRDVAALDALVRQRAALLKPR